MGTLEVVSSEVVSYGDFGGGFLWGLRRWSLMGTSEVVSAANMRT